MSAFEPGTCIPGSSEPTTEACPSFIIFFSFFAFLHTHAAAVVAVVLCTYEFEMIDIGR